MTKKIVLVSVVVFLLIFIPVSLYFYSLKQISVVNHSKIYIIEYRETPAFNEYLEKWGFWEKDKIYLDIYKKKYTIKKIKIYITDRVQPYYKFEWSEKGMVLSSINEYVDDDGTLHIQLHLNSSLPTIESDKYIKDLLTFNLISRIYVMTHSYQNYLVRSEEILKVTERFKKSPSDNPFIVHFKK